MVTQKLILTGLMAFCLVSLNACRKSSKNQKTAVNGKAANADNSKKTTLPVDPNKKSENMVPPKPEAKPGTKPDAPAGGSINNPVADKSNPLNRDGKKDDVLKKKVTCTELDATAKSLGWKINSLDVTEDKVKIVYYTFEKSTDDMANPVIYFNKNAFQAMTKKDLENFANLYDKYKIDPILMDMRGAGCSSALPDIKTKTSELNKYGSQSAVADAEKIRKKVLKDKKWKVLAYQGGGAVALRYAQVAPLGIKSIHVADFVPMKNQTQLMKLRVTQESAVFAEIMKEERLTDEQVKKALENLDSENCEKLGGSKKCKVLIDTYGGRKMSYKKDWSTIANLFKELAEGKKKSSTLMESFEKRKKLLDKSMIARILDIDADKNLSACKEVASTESTSTINSCRFEVLLGQGTHAAAIKAALRHSPLDLAKIKKNLTENNITYYLVSGKYSTLYPYEAFEKHKEELGAILDSTWRTIETGSEVIENVEFLESLRK